MILVQKRHWIRQNQVEKCFAYDGIRWWQYNIFVDFFNAAVKYFAISITMSLAVAVGMMSLWGNQETVCPMRT